MTMRKNKKNDRDIIDLLLMAGYRFGIKDNTLHVSPPDLSPPICDGCGYRFSMKDGEAPEDSGLCFECDHADHSCQHCDSGELSIDVTPHGAYAQEPEYRDEQCDHCEGKG